MNKDVAQICCKSCGAMAVEAYFQNIVVKDTRDAVARHCVEYICSSCHRKAINGQEMRRAANLVANKGRVFDVEADGLDQVLDFVKIGHRQQLIKYINTPYYLHPIELVRILRDVQDISEDVLVAALCHDLVEDTEVTLQQIEQKFGFHVACLVEMVTDVSKPSDGNRATRKEIDHQHLAKASPEGKTIKLADIISNTRSIVMYDPEFAKVYLREKDMVLPDLKEGNAKLYIEACEIVNRSKQLLNL